MTDLSNTKLRGYEIQTVLGTGGFGVVYRAYQPVIDRLVAIKAIHPDFVNNPDFVRRFEREAQFIARLEHLHIVPIYDYWRDPFGAYLVMRLLLGGNLGASLYHDGPWDLTQAARLIDQIASALHAAHQEGVVHQDIKPENILLDKDKNAYLTDFGIAKDIASGSSGERDVYGSPAYISPEHAMGTVVTPRSDIYSFGLLAFALLVGKSPFQDHSVTTMINKAIHNPVPSVSEIRPGLSPDVDRVLRCATSKSPMGRYEDVLTFAAEFRYALSMSENIPFKVVNQRKPPSENGTDGHPMTTAPMGAKVTPHPAPTLNIEQPGTLEVPRDITPPVAPAHTHPLPGRTTLKNPFKGLRAFDESDAGDFFGREALITRLTERMQEQHAYARFLAVVGASGSGKSSVVKAGLIPALRLGAIQGSDRWFVSTMVPGSSPLIDLEQAVLRVAFEIPARSLKEQFAESDRGLYDAIGDLLPGEGAELLLFIDQFEEVFVLADETQRTRFLNNLHYAVTAPDSRLRLIVTLRADFYDRPLLVPGFGDLMRTCTEVVLPLTPAELERSIERPAVSAGLMIDRDLKAAIIADIHNQPGALPLLQFALTELFERRDGNRLMLQTYQQIGGVSGSLAKRADELFEYLEPYQQEIARKIFLRLVALGGEGVDDTRRRALRTELLSITSNREAVEQVINMFGRYRLLTFDRDPETRTPTVEIAHESLIREWRRLHDWLDASHDDLRMQQRLSAAAVEWLNAGRDESFLVRGARLVQFESLLAGDTIALSEQERDFIKSSIQLRRRSANRLKLFIAMLIAATLAALVMAGLAFEGQNRALVAQETAVAERDRANAEAQISRSRELALAALHERNRLDAALLISLEALSNANTIEARRSLLTGLLANRNVETFFHAAGPLRSVALSPDGSLLASGGEDRTITLWSMTSRQPVAVLTGHDDTVWDVAFSPDGARLASAGRDGTVRLWDVSECGDASCQVPTESLVLDEFEGDVWSVAFSPDGERLASGDASGLVLLWDLTGTAPEPMPLYGHGDSVFSVTFSPDGRLLATAGADDRILLWDVSSGAEPTAQVLRGHANWVLSLAFDSTGTLLASAGAENAVYLWDVSSRTLRGSFNANHSDWIRAVAFAPGLPLLATASADNTIRLWDLSTGQPVGSPLRAHTDAIWDVIFTPDGEQFLSAGLDSAVILWDVRPQQRLVQRLTGHTEAVWAVAASPDGRWLASGGGETGSGGADFAIRLWDMDEICSGAQLCAPTEATLLNGHEDIVTALAFSPDGTLLASGSADRSILLWDVKGDSAAWGEQVDLFLRHQGSVTGLVFSPEGSRLYSADDLGVILAWERDGDTWNTMPMGDQPQGVTSLAISPDGQMLVSAGQNGQIIRWDVANRALFGEPMQGHQDVVTSIAFSPDGTLLASGSRDNTVMLWNAETGQPISEPLRFHTHWVNSVAISPDGALLASGSRDHTIMLWDIAATPQMLGQALTGHTNRVNTLAFTPDGSHFVSAGWEPDVLLWDVSLESWTAMACQIANRDLTLAEWSRLGSAMPGSSSCMGR